jgi:GNAT superfamily N-acetyltransferase
LKTNVNRRSSFVNVLNHREDITNLLEKATNALSQILPGKITFNVRKSTTIGKHGGFEFIFSSDNMWVSHFNMCELPGCCGIIVSFHANVRSKYRGKGIGTMLAALRVEIARHLGYTVMLCTDVASNEAQQKILSKIGWEKVSGFVNKRTNNEVHIHVIHL